MSDPVMVTVTDPDSGEVLGKQLLDNDYVVVCAGNHQVSNVQRHGNGTHVITVKRQR